MPHRVGLQDDAASSYLTCITLNCDVEISLHAGQAQAKCKLGASVQSQTKLETKSCSFWPLPSPGGDCRVRWSWDSTEPGESKQCGGKAAVAAGQLG